MCITNENKTHSINLSRTFKLDDTNNSPETGAQIIIESNNNINYNFTETSNGVYVSNTAFKAEKNTSYTLKITTKNGRTYSSSSQKLTAITQIDKLTTTKENSIEGEEGVSIYVHSFNPNNDANYYRYTYEETQKISPPFWSDKKIKIVSDTRPYRVEVIDRIIDNKDCYSTTFSKKILITETKSLSEDRVNFPVKFILSDNFLISNRYSILVKQYVQTFEAHNYYKTLEKLTSSSNVLTQTQPGFINGNISSDTDKNENVIGFFEVSSVSEKRIFFNFSDIFPNKSAEFISSCNFQAPILSDPFSGESPLIDLIKDDTHTYFKENDTGLQHLEGRYLMVPKICGDCTVLGTNVKPSFWID